MRNDIEILRLIAIFGIVWFHSGVPLARDVAYSGLIIFTMLSAYLTVSSSNAKSFSDRVSRLIIPFVTWSIFYAAISIIRDLRVFPENRGVVTNILSSPSIHLWYLPFLFVCNLIYDSIRSRLASKYLFIMSSMLSSILILSAGYWRQFELLQPFGQYIHALPAYLIGISFSLSLSLSKAYRRLGILLLSIVALVLLETNVVGFSIPYLFGVSITLFTLSTNYLNTSNRLVFKISSLTFGIYLVHPFAILVVQKLGIYGVELPMLAISLSALLIFVATSLLPNRSKKLLF